MLEDGVREDGEEDRCGVCKTRRLHYHAVERRYLPLVLIVKKLQERADEVLAGGATHAAVLEEDRLLVGAYEEMVVEAHLTELADENGRVRHRRSREHPREQRGLATPQEARDDRDRPLRRFILR